MFWFWLEETAGFGLDFYWICSDAHRLALSQQQQKNYNTLDPRPSFFAFNLISINGHGLFFARRNIPHTVIWSMMEMSLALVTYGRRLITCRYVPLITNTTTTHSHSYSCVYFLNRAAFFFFFLDVRSVFFILFFFRSFFRSLWLRICWSWHLSAISTSCLVRDKCNRHTHTIQTGPVPWQNKVLISWGFKKKGGSWELYLSRSEFSRMTAPVQSFLCSFLGGIFTTVGHGHYWK